MSMEIQVLAWDRHTNVAVYGDKHGDSDLPQYTIIL
jgi:hypothetical protein